MAKFRQNFHTNLAKRFSDDVYYGKSNLYYFVGRIDSWDASDTKQADPDYAYMNDITIRDNIVFFKKISAEDVSVGARRFDWTAGTVYDQWDDTIDFVSPKSTSGLTVEYYKYYVVNSENNVYVCLNNNLGDEDGSTEEPTGDSIEPIALSDGYIWKYLYTISNIKSRKFMSSAYIPVQRSVTDSFYTTGAIESATVVEPGANYPVNKRTYIKVLTHKDSTSIPAKLYQIAPVLEDGDVVWEDDGEGTSTYKLKSITIQEGNYGWGYYNKSTDPAKVVVKDYNASGKEIEHVGETAVLEPVIDHGKFTRIDIINAGTGYSERAKVIIDSPPSEFVQRVLQVALDSDGSIVSVNTDEENYRYVGGTPGYKVVGDGYAKYSAGTSASVNFNMVRDTSFTDAVVYKLDSVSIIDPGIKYDLNSYVSITISGDGIGAEVVPEVNNDGEISAAYVTKGGEGYTFANLRVVSGSTGDGASVVTTVGGSKMTTRQAAVEQLAHYQEGSVYAYATTTVGTGYNEQTTVVTITGDGHGAAAKAKFDGNKLIGLVPISYGSGYTYVNISVVDKERLASASTTDFECYAILPPRKGHGYDAIDELNGKVAIAYVTLKESDTDLSSLNQDYRQFGIISNIRNYNMNNLATKTSISPLYTLTLGHSQETDQSISEFEDTLDKVVIIVHDDQSVKHKIVKVDGDTVKVQQLSYILKLIEEGDPLTLEYTYEDGTTSEFNFEIKSVDGEPIVDKYSGDLMTVTNIVPIYISKEHTVGIRSYIKF